MLQYEVHYFMQYIVISQSNVRRGYIDRFLLLCKGNYSFENLGIVTIEALVLFTEKSNFPSLPLTLFLCFILISKLSPIRTIQYTYLSIMSKLNCTDEKEVKIIINN